MHSQVSQLFGYSAEKADFVNEHYSILVATIIPWAMKHEQCLGLIEEICEIIQKDLSTVLCSSFLCIYPHLYLYETAEINNKGMQYIVQQTENSLYHLLKSDAKVSTTMSRKNTN